MLFWWKYRQECSLYTIPVVIFEWSCALSKKRFFFFSLQRITEFKDQIPISCFKRAIQGKQGEKRRVGSRKESNESQGKSRNNFLKYLSVRKKREREGHETCAQLDAPINEWIHFTASFFLFLFVKSLEADKSSVFLLDGCCLSCEGAKSLFFPSFPLMRYEFEGEDEGLKETGSFLLCLSIMRRPEETLVKVCFFTREKRVRWRWRWTSRRRERHETQTYRRRSSKRRRNPSQGKRRQRWRTRGEKAEKK